MWLQVSHQAWLQLSQVSATGRGALLAHGPGESRGLLDTAMFGLVWAPAVHAMAALLEAVDSEPLARAALEGLKTAAKAAAHHETPEVVDVIMAALVRQASAISTAPAPGSGSREAVRPDVALGSSPRACLACEAVFHITCRYADCLRTGWADVMELVVKLYR